MTSAKSIKEAIKEVKSNAKAKFDETIELHINLDLDVTKTDQTIRTTVDLPNGSGKELTVLTITAKNISNADISLLDSDFSQLENSQIKPKADFDILIVEPQVMPKIAKLGATLGPAGVMPNPKNGTVTDDVEKAVADFKKGKVEIRNELSAPVIHTVIGRVSFSEKDLEENFTEIIETLKKNKPAKAKPNWIKGMFISSSMGKSVQVEFSQ